MQRKGIPVDVTTMTVGKYLQQWLEDVARHQVRPTTYRSYEQLVRLYLVPGLGKKKLRALQAQHVRTWLSGLATKCQCCAQFRRPEQGRCGEGSMLRSDAEGVL